MTQILELGLLSESDDGLTREVKRRLFWTCFIIDAWASGGSNLSPQFRWRNNHPRGPNDEYIFYRMKPGGTDIADSDWKSGFWASIIVDPIHGMGGSMQTPAKLMPQSFAMC